MAVTDPMAKEKKTIQAMIEIYCAEKHAGSKDNLCGECTELLDYACKRLDNCPFGPDKGP